MNWARIVGVLRGSAVPVWIEPAPGQEPRWLRMICADCDWVGVDWSKGQLLDGPYGWYAHRKFVHGED
jgi:hypothetical protein